MMAAVSASEVITQLENAAKVLMVRHSVSSCAAGGGSRYMRANFSPGSVRGLWVSRRLC